MFVNAHRGYYTKFTIYNFKGVYKILSFFDTVLNIDRKTKLSVILYFMQNQSSANNNATKSDVNKIVKQSEKVLRQEILRVEEKVESLEERVGGLEEGQNRMERTLNKISTQLDGFVGRVDDLTTENVVGTNQMRNIKISVEDHEKRIKVLESS